MNKKTLVVFLNWKSEDTIVSAIKNILLLKNKYIFIIVIDNEKNSHCKEKLLTNFGSSVVYKFSGGNIGYAAGNNIGIKYGLKNGFDYICVMNSDVTFDNKYILKAISDLSSNSSIDCVSGLMMHTDSSLESAGGSFDFNSWTELFPQIHNFPEGSLYEVDIVNGTFFMAKSLVFKKQLIPEDYFMYYEDLDWSYSVKKLGFQIWIDPNIKIYHEGGKSSQGSIFKDILQSRNYLYFIQKLRKNGVKIRPTIYFFKYVMYPFRNLFGALKANSGVPLEYRMKVFRGSFIGLYLFLRKHKGNIV